AALNAHDRQTRGHSERVRVLTDLLADALRMPKSDRDRLRWAALLHDIGKLEVSAGILNKPGKPEPHEWEALKRHPAAGARLAGPLFGWLGDWGAAIEQHHERYDGGGYPGGLSGIGISMGGRILAITDSFETMTASRSYKKPMSVSAARRELAGCAGTQFDPDIVRTFIAVSLGRLWWKVGPVSWAAQLPFISLRTAGTTVATAARAAVGIAALGASAFVSPPSQQPQRTAITAEPVAGPAAGTVDPGTSPSSSTDDAGKGTQGGDDPGGASDAGDGPQGEDSGSGEGSGGSGGGGSSSEPGGGGGGDDTVGDVVDDVGGVVDDTVDTVDDVVDEVDEVVDDVVDVVDDVVDDLGDVVGGLKGSLDGN
ncbi:MAG: HD-GYP domain-containing protein, partial [Actinomycetota bacterium]